MEKKSLNQEYVEWLDKQIENKKRNEPYDFCSFRDWKWRYKRIPLEDL